MKFPRRSLSASLGSWCVQLIYNPLSTDEKSALWAADAVAMEVSRGARRALMPAFLAVFLAVAAACYALAHFIALPVALKVLLFSLTLGSAVSWGARCAPPTLRRICGAARWPLAFLLGLCALSLRWSEGFAQLLAGQPNMQAAVFSGFITLLSVLLIGARSGGRLVPVAAPLVPSLALFGLLCLVAVDGTTQACFLLFTGAALYLLCYDRFLRRAAPDLSSGVWNIAPHAIRRARGDAPAWALQSILVSSVWFALFLGGGGLLFWPLQTVISKIAAPHWEREESGRGDRKLDYSGGAPVMELRGGTHTLSDRIFLRVTPVRGVPSGTWRGRVYEKYERSLWGERSGIDRIVAEKGAIIRLVRPRALGSMRATEPILAPRSGTIERIAELVVPLGGVANVVYSSGLPLSFDVRPKDFDSSDPERSRDLTSSQAPYIVRSFNTQPNLRVLDATPGVDLDTDKNLPSDLRAILRQNLQLPPENSTRAVLKTIADKIESSRSAPMMPSEKARAIAGYLRANCFYSLQAPAVPPTDDATVFFLTDARRGACDMFASSQALLLREMGVPARVVTGFLDPQTPESSIENPDGRITKILRERDAHAWVEYYVPKYGWLSIDSTQNTRELPTTLAGHLAELFDLSHLKIPPALLALPALGLTLLLIGLFWQRRTNAGTRERENERQRIEAAYRSALHLLRRRVPHAPHLSPGEYETRVTQSDVPAVAKQEFAALTHLYLCARYGPAPEASSAQVEACLSRLKQALRRGAKE